jgi:hypothetical protein
MCRAIGRLITSPLFAVIACAAGAAVIWFAVLRQPGGSANPNLAGNQPNVHRAPDEGRPGAVARRSSAANETSGTHKLQSAANRIAARSSVQPRKPSGQGKLEIEEYVAENEPAASPTDSTAPDRPQTNPRESATPSTADTIGPRDPRAKALTEYAVRKAAVASEAIAHKRLAAWCDEQGLWDAAKTHWEVAIQLDPKSDEARRRLGYRSRGGQWVFDHATAEAIVQRKAEVYWEKTLRRLHAAMRCRSKAPVSTRADAVTSVQGVGDPRAATAIWNAFSADTHHHGMMVEVLTRFNNRKASQMLAALAVYSQDRKSQVAALSALHGRRPADYGERLVSLMHAPLRVEERQVPIPGRAPVRQLLVEGDTANYEFLFSKVEAPAPDTLASCFQPRLNPGEIEIARQFNAHQAAMASEALDQQVKLARQMIARYNDSIRALNTRVADVLREACNARIRPEPADGQRWLAQFLGADYKPPTDGPKPTFQEIVSPLYNPTFLPVPVPT